MMIYKFFTVVSCILLTICLHGQYSQLDLRIEDASLDNYQFIEQIGMDMDQEYYLAGEKIQMSIQTFDATFHLPVKISSIAYVELYTQDNQVVGQQKIKLDNGSGSGYLQIPKTLQTDYYYLRAYTNYMKNYGPAFYYTRRLEVVNPFYPIEYEQSGQAAEARYTFTVKPESGKLVAGRKNKVVYYGLGQSGYCSEIVGRIVDDHDSVVVRATSNKAIGTVSFIPQKNRTYRFEALVCDNKTSVDIPMASSHHDALLIDSLSEGKAYLQIVTDPHRLSAMKLQIINQNMTYISDRFNIQQSFHQISIPSGINMLQLVSSDEQVLATRYIAVAGQENIDINVQEEKQVLQKRQQQKLQISTTDLQGNPVSSRLAVSVLLSDSEHNPFQSSQPQFKYMGQLKRCFPAIPTGEWLPFVRDRALLNDFLTAQTSGKSADQYLAFEEKFPAEPDKDIVTGTVIHENTGNPASGKAVIQSFIDSVSWLNVDITDQDGNFLMEIEEDYAGNEIFFVLRDTTGNYKVGMDDEFGSAFLPLEKAVYQPDLSLRAEIQQRMINLQVQDAYSENKEKQRTKPRLRFYGNPDVSYRFDDYITLPTLEEFAFEIVTGAVIQRIDKQIHVYVYSNEKGNIIGPDPLYLIDGVPVFDKNMFAQIPPEIMKTFHVVGHKYYYKTLSFDGIIDITSKNGDFLDFPEPNNAYRSYFTPVQSGESKSIGDSTQHSEPTPRYLSTVYFNPDVQTDSSGKAEINITAPDNTGKYTILINARNEKGETGFVRLPGFIEVVD